MAWGPLLEELAMNHRRLWVGPIVLTLVGAATVVACSDNGAVTLLGDRGVGGDGGPPTGAGVGQHCDDSTLCRSGLACTGGLCAPGHSSGDGTPCVISAECKMLDFCGPMHTCV